MRWRAGSELEYDGYGLSFILDRIVIRLNELWSGGRGFKNWTKLNHRQPGEVEIGGYNPKFFRQNPPPEFLEEWASKEALFNLMLAKSLPQVKILSAEVRPVEKKAGQQAGKLAGNLDKDKDLFELSCVVTNEGFLPTALKMADRVKIVRPDWVEIRLPEGAELEKGLKSKIEIGHLKSGEKKEVRWRFKMKAFPAEAEVSIFSTRGGVDKLKVPFTTQ